MRTGQQGVEDESWRKAQLFASIASCLALDEDSMRIMGASVARTPRYRVDGDHWVHVHPAMAERLTELVIDEGARFRTGRMPRPSDLILLAERFDPKIRIVLDVVPTRGDAKLVCFDAGDETGQREFMTLRVGTAAWR